MEQNPKKCLASEKVKGEVEEHICEETKAESGDNVMKYSSPFFSAKSKQDNSSIENTNGATTLNSNTPQLVESKTDNTKSHVCTYRTKSTGDASCNKMPGTIHADGIVFSEDELKSKFEKCTVRAIKLIHDCDGYFHYVITTTTPLLCGNYKLCPIEVGADNAKPELSKSFNSNVDISGFSCQIIDELEPMKPKFLNSSGDNAGLWIVLSEDELQSKFEKCTVRAIKLIHNCDGYFHYVITTTTPLLCGKYELCPIWVGTDNAKPELSKSFNSNVNVSGFSCQIIDELEPMKPKSLNSSGDNAGGANTSNVYPRRSRRRSGSHASSAGIFKSNNLFSGRKRRI